MREYIWVDSNGNNNNYYNTDNNVVLVTHQGVIDIIMRILGKRSSELKELC